MTIPEPQRLQSILESFDQKGVLVFGDAMLRPTLVGLVGAALTWGVVSIFGDDQWWKLVCSVSAGEIVFVILILAVGFTSEERARLLSFVSMVRRRFWGATNSVGVAANESCKRANGGD